MRPADPSESAGFNLALSSLVASSGLPGELVAKRMCDNPAGFWPHPPGITEQMLRRGLLPLTRYNERFAIGITSLLKRLRPSRSTSIPDPGSLPLVLGAADGQDARGASCVLTHDVDWARCYESLDWLCALESRFCVRSTFHVLTEWRYRPDPARLAAMAADGFEIGLHGRLHDAALGFRSRTTIRRELQRALRLLPEGVLSYRAPALCISKPLLEALASLGIRADSSMLVVNRHGAGAESVWPYLIHPGVMELPLCIQDDLLFRDLRLSDDDALEVVRSRMRPILAANGIFVFNGHPGILCDHPRFYEGLLQTLRDEGIRTETVAQVCARHGQKRDRASGPLP